MQDNGWQNSTMIYDKDTGVLVYSKVESAFGPDLEIQLSDYELNFQITPDLIPGFPIIWISGIFGMSVAILTIFKVKKTKIT